MAAPTSTLLNRLQHTGGQVVILNAPPEFRQVMDKWRADGLPVSQRRTPGSRFVLAFVHSCRDIERLSGAVVTSVGLDGVLWFAYPKQTSTLHRTDIGRQGSWAVLGRMGFESVRQVAVDEDWTALRFRHVDRIREATRDQPRATPAPGRARVGGAA